jgi:diaminopimelate decarboxylase
MSYLESESQWNDFWRQHGDALAGRRSPITYRNHGLGLSAVDGQTYGERNVYPYFQRLVQGEWLASILNAKSDGMTVAHAVRSRGLQLRCELGRSLLDGCGLTIARVEFTKRHYGGDWFVGLSMNHTQCRTGSDDFLVDPIVIRSICAGATTNPPQPMEGYLVGTYCTESELLLLRKLRFPHGIAAGDLVAFPNTAGYLMHFLESRSHQFPLAKNVILDGDKDCCLDDIDRLPTES